MTFRPVNLFKTDGADMLINFKKFPTGMTYLLMFIKHRLDAIFHREKLSQKYV